MRSFPAKHLVVGSTAAALAMVSAEAVAEPDLLFGGLGFASAGARIGPFGDLGADLEPALGEGASPGAFFPTLGGGGWMVLPARFMLGGRGFAVLAPSVSGALGTASLHGGGGGLAVGYSVVSDAAWLAYPFVGAGGCGFELTLSNESLEPIRFGTNESIPVGTSRRYEGGFVYLEVGLGVQDLLMWHPRGADGQGGFALGAELGFTVSSFNSRWGNENDVAMNDVDTVRFNGGFLRLTLGGGGFFLTE